MRRLLSILTSLIIFIFLSSTSFGAGIDKSQDLRNYFVGFDSRVDASVIKNLGGKVDRQYQYMPVLSVKLPEQAVQGLKNNPKVVYVEPDGIVQAIGQEVPWGVQQVNATEVQDSGMNGTGIKVGIIDTGIDYNHEDLQVKGGVTFVEGTTDYMDDNGHGTHVAGQLQPWTMMLEF